MIDLSIIIPVYNCEAFLEKGFSHLRPLYASSVSFEIIYVNDGSTDNSLTVLEKIQSENNYINVLSQKNGGVTRAQNAGLEIAQGSYITFLDADDWLDANVLIRAVLASQKDNLDMYGFSMQKANEKCELLSIVNSHPITYNKVASGVHFLTEGYQPSSICPFVFSSDFLKSNHLRFVNDITHKDVEISVRMFLKAQRVFFVEEVGYYYYTNTNSITQSKDIDRVHQYMMDTVLVAKLVNDNCTVNNSVVLNEVIRRQSNSIVWNLLLRIFKNTDELSWGFINSLKKDLMDKEVYPINGQLKTRFQRITRMVMNSYLYWTIVKLKTK